MIRYQLVDYPSRPTAVVRGRVRVSDLATFFGQALTRVLSALEAQGTIPGGEPFAYFRDVPNGSVDVEAGFPIVGGFEASGDVTRGELPGGRVVTGVRLGPYATLKQTYAEMTAWAIAHGMKPTGDMWEVYLTDPERELDPARWRTGIFLRIE